MTVRVSRHDRGQTLYLSPGCGIPPLPLPPPLKVPDDTVFSGIPSGHGHPRLRVKDVRAKNIIFLCSERWGESFWAGTSARISAAAFWGFSRGGFPENACIGGAISERNLCEICRIKSPQNTEKHKTKLCAEVTERPLPKDPFFQLLTFSRISAKLF